MSETSSLVYDALIVIAILLIVLIVGMAAYRRKYTRFLRSLFQDRSRMIVGLRSDGTVFSRNEMARRLISSFPSGATISLKRPYFDVHELRPISDIVKAFLLSNEDYTESEVRLVLAGKPRDMLLQLTRLDSRAVIGKSDIILTLQDITERNEAKKHEALSRFAEEMAHDLRKPLAPIVLWLQELQVHLNLPNPDTKTMNERYVGPSLQQIDLLSRYIERLWTAFRSGQAPLEEIDIENLLLFAGKTKLSILHPIADINVDVQERLPKVKARFDDMERVFSELIDNAIESRNNSRRSTIEIRARRSGENGSRIHIEMEDNGQGIDAKLISRIFEPYFSTRRERHQGLGLYTVRKLIAQYGGTIDVESTVGVGTKFVINLPGVEEL